MEFSAKIKKQVREASAFRCCICRVNPCFHTHHIDPEMGNDFDNAAPLCPTCHDRYGNDFQKRKFIRQARDDWYEKVKHMYPNRKEEFNLNKEILDKIEKLESKSISKEEFVKEIIPTFLDTIYSFGNDLKRYVEKKDYDKLTKTLSSLGSSATYSSDQIESIWRVNHEKPYQPKSTPSIFIPAGSRWPIVCPHCHTSIYDQRIGIGSICPYCKNSIS